jgi:hypothetical protein
MDLGPLSGYRLPTAIRNAYGVDTAQQLADQLGVSKRPTPELGAEADAAYQALKKGDSAPARSLLVNKLGVNESAADAALAKLPKL